MQDRDMLAKYLTLSVADPKTVCDVVGCAGGGRFGESAGVIAFLVAV